MAPADFGITQFFFDADHYRRMVDDLGDLGCDPPLLPGVITVTNPTSVKRFAGIHVYTLNVLEAAEGCWTGWVRAPSGELPASGPPERRVPDAGPVCRLFR